MAAASAYYVALGDSMTIDLYPNNDAWRRWKIAGRSLGAGSLFYRNDPLWPEFEGLDLRTRHPELRYENEAMDGATIDVVLQAQLPTVRRREVAIATLTIGGNDLLGALMMPRGPLETSVAGIGRRYEDLVTRIREECPRARLILTTVYDPTDATGRMPGYPHRLPIELLDEMNELIRAVARRTQGAYLADVHAHFRGYGASRPEDERWYWESHIIEPSARGASEIRRAWWVALGDP